jgi:hypothetical protein
MNADELYELKRLRQESADFIAAYDALVKLLSVDSNDAPNHLVVIEVEGKAARLRARLAGLSRSIAQEKTKIVSAHMSLVARKRR